MQILTCSTNTLPCKCFLCHWGFLIIVWWTFLVFDANPTRFYFQLLQRIQANCSPLACIRSTMMKEKLTVGRSLVKGRETDERIVLDQGNLLKGQKAWILVFSKPVTMCTAAENNLLSRFWEWQLLLMESLTFKCFTVVCWSLL